MAEVGTSKITGGGGLGSHNKPIGCGASGAYGPGTDDEEEDTRSMKHKNSQHYCRTDSAERELDVVGCYHCVRACVCEDSKPSVCNSLNAELNPICYLPALLGAHHLLHVSRIRVKLLTLRLLMSYTYIYIHIYIYMERLFLMFLDHTQRRTTVGRNPLDE